MKKTAHKKVLKKDPPKAVFKINLDKKLIAKWLVPGLTTFVVLVLMVVALVLRNNHKAAQTPQDSNTPPQSLSAANISLPTPDYRSSNSIELVLKNRRTDRAFTDQSLTLKQISQMLWAAQGVTVDWGGRTAPSAKSTYPLTVYLIANKVDGLDPGEYQYIPGDRTMVHQLKPIKKVEIGEALAKMLNQSSYVDVPATFVITGNLGKMAEAYGGIPHDRDVYLEAGHVGQNLYLQAESLKLGVVTNTNFDELKVKELVTVPDTDTVIYLVPIGYPKL